MPVLIALAVLLAGLYGAIHNQISYTVGPDYFHAFKFIQFGIPPEYQNRIGAAIVGWFASWWMGLIIGVPIALATLALPTPRAMVRAFLRAVLIVLAVALALGSLSLALTLPSEVNEIIRIPAGVTDETGFIRAAVMHEVSYGAGLVGLVLGLVAIGFSIKSARDAAGKK
jgi:hypothetical protein